LNSGEYDDLAKGCAAVVWCATSFGSGAGSDPPPETDLRPPSPLEGFFRQLQGLPAEEPPPPTKTLGGPLDADGVAAAASSFGEAAALLAADAGSITPKFVLLSSAAVSRVEWNKSRQSELPAAFDIPIVKLNPKDILGTKLSGEKSLRESGLPYAIVRPCGLNDEQPPGRLVLSSGDVATGRISRSDLAELLVGTLFEKGAVGKTFEAFTLSDLPKRPIADALAVLPEDSGADGPQPDSAAYNVLVQLTPGGA